MGTIDIDNFFEKHHIKIIVIFLILILISRIYKFGELPLAIGVDEAGAAYDAYSIANYGVDRYLNSAPVYLINFGGGQSVLYAYLNALLIKITGQDNILISRLPELIMFLMAIFVSYKLVEKKQDKKTAIVFTFLIIVCPWLIAQCRYGLDCYLLGPMFMLDLYLLENAKKSWHYIIAGISVGITLYTYSLSWIILPAFLLIWVIYHLYTKTTTIKNVVILAITVFLFALPLILFLLSNMGVINIEKIGIFTIPKLYEFRAGEISILNLFLSSIKSLKTIFNPGVFLYYFEIPFFIIGIIVGIKDVFINSKKREYSFLTFMTITFLTILIANLLICVTSSTKANILYIPINYFIAIGTLQVIKNTKMLWIVFGITYIILFSIFEIKYYTNDAIKENHMYEDIYLTNAINYIRAEKLENKEIHVYTYKKAEPYIYVLLNEKMSPYEFDKTKNVEKINTNEKSSVIITRKIGNYYFNDGKIPEKYEEDKIYIVDKKYNLVIDELESLGYMKEQLEGFYILK